MKGKFCLRTRPRRDQKNTTDNKRFEKGQKQHKTLGLRGHQPRRSRIESCKKWVVNLKADGKIRVVEDKRENYKIVQTCIIRQ